jgi:hypothetical protein
MRYPDSIQIAYVMSGLVLATACASKTAEPRQPAASPAATSTNEPQTTGEPTASHDDSALVALLSSSKLGLADGIALAERQGGKAIGGHVVVDVGSGA